jgi:hypothetical protein
MIFSLSSQEISVVINRPVAINVAVHIMTDYPADSSWVGTVMEPEHISIIAGNFKWAHAVIFTGDL